MYQHTEMNVDKPQQIVLFTYGTEGTLGDPSAAAKLIDNMKKQYGASVNITVVLMMDKNEKATINLFEGLDITLVPTHKEDSFYKDDSIELSKLLDKTDSIIFFPNSFITLKNTCQTILDKTRNQQKIFIVNEYDLEKKREGELELRAIKLNSGLGEGSLGIFCTQEKQVSNRPSVLLEIKDSDKPCRDLLLEGEANKELFFGYYNNLNSEDKDLQVNPLVFIESCLGLASQETEVLDFVLPLKPEGPPHKNVDTIFAHLAAQGYQVEYWHKNNEGKMVCTKSCEGSGKKIRLINGFPFTPDTMSKLMKASADLVMVTGDQSLSEAISNGKIFLYQTMTWKRELHISLTELVKNVLQEDSKLYQFLNMQMNASSPEQSIQSFLQQHKNELLAEMRILQKYILENKNLYATLPVELMSYFNNKEKYIEDCLANIRATDPVESIAPLLKMFPNERETISNILIKQKKSDLAQNLNSLQKNMHEDVDNFVEYYSDPNCEKERSINLTDIDLNLIDDEHFTKFCDTLAQCKRLGTKEIWFRNYRLHTSLDPLALNNLRFAKFYQALSQGGVETFGTDQAVKKTRGSDLLYFKTIFSRLPNDIRSTEIQKKDAAGNSLLHLVVKKNLSDPQEIQEIFEFYPMESRLQAVLETNRDGDSVLHVAAKNPESLKKILELLAPKNLHEAVRAKNKQGKTVLESIEPSSPYHKEISRLLPPERGNKERLFQESSTVKPNTSESKKLGLGK